MAAAQFGFGRGGYGRGYGGYGGGFGRGYGGGFGRGYGGYGRGYGGYGRICVTASSANMKQHHLHRIPHHHFRMVQRSQSSSDSDRLVSMKQTGTMKMFALLWSHYPIV
ncbi:hypothetical protein MTO96_031636 [Rhipicephalus appendiculatus]